MDEGAMLGYLSWAQIAVGHVAFALVMDSYPAHITPRVHHKAQRLGIELIPVPRGRTGQYQPLDRSCFGPLKKMSQRRWDEKTRAEPHMKWTHKRGAELLEESWAFLSRETIRHGWAFPEIVQSISAPDGFVGVPESSASDEEYREGDSEESEPGSSGTWSSRFDRIERVRARAQLKREDPVLEVQAYFHKLSTVHPEWDEAGWIERCRQKQMEEKSDQCDRREQERAERKAEAELHKAWLFPQPSARRVGRPDPPISPGGFVFPQWQYHRAGHEHKSSRD
jgi:hypothetical protein